MGIREWTQVWKRPTLANTFHLFFLGKECGTSLVIGWLSKEPEIDSDGKLLIINVSSLR